jgi:signal transduction histidine kinase
VTLFHFPTAYFIAGVLFLAMPSALWLLLRQTPARGLSLWSSGGLVFGLGLMLLGSRGELPEWMTHGLANSLLFSGAALWVLALRRKLGLPMPVMVLILFNLVFWLVYELFHSWWVNPTWRFLWSTCIVCGMLFWVAGLARELGLRRKSFSAKVVTLVYMALGLVLAVRAISVLLGLTQPEAMHVDVLSMVVITMGVLTSVVGNIGFLGVVLERVSRKLLAIAQAQARQEESKRLLQQITQLERQRSVGQIAASLGHELSQPLTNLHLIIDRMAMAQENHDGRSLADDLRALQRNTQKATDILHRIRTFIRTQDIQFEPIELGQVIADVNDLIHDLSFNESVHIQVTLPAEKAWVLGDAVQLSQILLNVLRNAIEATHGQPDRRIQITVRREKTSLVLEVLDNGPGMTPDVLAQIATPFFSTKPDGLGVGLSIAQSIAKQHRGSLQMDNHPDGGARVCLQLPEWVQHRAL